MGCPLFLGSAGMSKAAPLVQRNGFVNASLYISHRKASFITLPGKFIFGEPLNLNNYGLAYTEVRCNGFLF
jgi:hypothetical protein